MKKIIKGACPKLLHSYQSQPGATFDDMDKDTKQELKKALLDEQGYICCYCGDRIEENHHSIIEHLKPKGLPEYTALQLEYSNLLCSCDGGEAERRGKDKRTKRLYPSHCDDNKGDEVLPLAPTDLDIEVQFSYDEEGHIYGESEAAKRAIQILNLDCSTIVNRRKAAIAPYLDPVFFDGEDCDSVIERLTRRNTEGQYVPYCFAAIYYIKTVLRDTAKL